MKTRKELEDFLEELSLEDCVFFSEEETISAIVGFEDSERCLVYDYNKLIESFMEHFKKSHEENNENVSEEELYTEAVEWVEYNTIRSLPYKNSDFIIYDENNNELERTYYYKEAENILNEKYNGKGKISEKTYKNPIIIHNIKDYDF